MAEPEVNATLDVTPETEEPAVEPEKVEPEKLEAHEQGSTLPEAQEIAEPQQSDAADVADSQPQSDAESNNVPEAEHPVGH